MAEITATRAGSANAVAFLDTLGFSEGTDDGKQRTLDRGYDVVVGGSLFTGYADHPRRLVKLGRGLQSTAAGRYQTLSRYYDHYRKLLKLPDFSPLSQDLIALQQIREFGALPLIHAGRFPEAVHKVRTLWASLPGAGYGQYEHKLSTLERIYKERGGIIV